MSSPNHPLNAPYVRADCRHTNPPVGPITAILDCGTRIDDPGVSFVAPDRDAAETISQAAVNQFSGDVCGGGSGAGEVWRRQTSPIGRDTCFVGKTSDPTPPRPTLMAVHEDLHLIVVVTGSMPDYPGDSPMTMRRCGAGSRSTSRVRWCRVPSAAGNPAPSRHRCGRWPTSSGRRGRSPRRGSECPGRG